MAMDDIGAARDAIIGRFAEVWADAWASPPGPDGENSAPEIFYDGLKKTPPQDGDSPYVFIRIRHLDGRQATLRSRENGARFRASGQVWVEVYSPINDGLTLNDVYVKVTQSAFEGHATSPDGVLFRNVKPREVGGKGDRYLTIVIADFEYDRIV